MGYLKEKLTKRLKTSFPHYVNEMKNNWRNFKAEGGESLSDLQKRSVAKINKIKNEHKNKKILVVVHAGVIQSLISYYLFNNLDGYWQFRLDNGSITKMTIMDDGLFILIILINKMLTQNVRI